MHSVYIVEDHEVVRDAYLRLISVEPDLTVCGTAGSAEAALEEVGASGADVLLVDIALPGMSGIELVQRLGGTIPALVVSGHDADQYLEAALGAGARGYVSKYGGATAILQGLRDVIRTLP